uniref:Uncharacterized protein n=1 Tax=Rhizophora mucronata TaxID=61149 RepID=A0A2P2NI09_RHIMU
MCEKIANTIVDLLLTRGIFDKPPISFPSFSFLLQQPVHHSISLYSPTPKSHFL